MSMEGHGCGSTLCPASVACVFAGKGRLRRNSAQLLTQQGGISPCASGSDIFGCDAGLRQGGADGARARQPALGRRLPHEDHLAPGPRLGALPGLLHCLPGAALRSSMAGALQLMMQKDDDGVSQLGELNALRLHRPVHLARLLQRGCETASKRSMAVAPLTGMASTCAPRFRGPNERECRWATQELCS